MLSALAGFRRSSGGIHSAGDVGMRRLHPEIMRRIHPKMTKTPLRMMRWVGMRGVEMRSGEEPMWLLPAFNVAQSV